MALRGVLGAHLSVLKVEVLNVGSKLFFRENLGVGSFQLLVWHRVGLGVYGEGLAQLFLPISVCVFS